MHSLLIILLTICVELPSTVTKQRETSAASAVLSGRVTNLFGSQLGGVVVRVLPYSVTSDGESRIETKTLSLEATTNNQGDYSISGMNPGVYTVSVELQGFRRFENCHVPLHPGVNTMDFGLEVGVNIDVPLIKFDGLVLGPNHLPIADATVTVVSIFNRDLTEQTRTNQNGRYEIAIQTPGHYVLYASKTGFAPAAKACITTKQRHVDFRLSRMP